MKVVIDTNVLLSALLFGGIPARLVDLWKNGRITPLVSAPIMAEYLRVLAYPKFKLTEEEINHLLIHEILPWFEAVQAPMGERYIAADPGDDKFVWCALAGRAEIIVSGDDHLLACVGLPVPVLNPVAFLKSLGLTG